MKRLIRLRGYAKAIFKDMEFVYMKASEHRRDLSRLLHELEFRGLTLLTVDFPAISKHLERCLDEGLYTKSGLALCGTRGGAQVPVFMQDLYLQIFCHDGKLLEDPNVDAIFFLRQLYRGFKKIELPCPTKETINEVVNFINNERDLRRPTLNWDRPLDVASNSNGDCRFTDILRRNDNQHPDDLFQPPRQNPEPGITQWVTEQAICEVEEGLLCTLQEVSDRIVVAFPDFSKDEDVLPKHGPGAVSDIPGGKSKFLFPNWPKRLDAVFPYDRYGVVNATQLLSQRENTSYPGLAERPCKLIAVPKEQSGPRLIASEPAAQMFCQQLISDQVRSAVKQHKALQLCIDFNSQVPNQELARRASNTGDYVTVDLKSASDRLTLYVIERMFRNSPSLLQRLAATRSQWVKNAIEPSKWDHIRLNKAFTQGNACTFPMQTICFAIMAIAAVLFERGDRINAKTIIAAAGSVRVYGDDIIIPQTAFKSLQLLLVMCQLKVNLTKTFSQGKFRESCGFDAYDGYDVTVANIKSIDSDPRHEKVISCLQSANNLHLKGLWHTSQWLMAPIKRWERLLPITNDRDVTGVFSYSGTSLCHLKKRYNEDYQREEYLTASLITKSKKTQTGTLYDFFQYIIERPSQDTEWCSGHGNRKEKAVLRPNWSIQTATR